MALASWRRVGVLKSDESYRWAEGCESRAFSNAAPGIANRHSAAGVKLSADRMHDGANAIHAYANFAPPTPRSMTTFTSRPARKGLQSPQVKDHGTHPSD